MSDSPVIRLARLHDLAAILDLYVHLHPGEPRLDEATAHPVWQRMMADTHLHIFLAELNGVPVASCMLVLTESLTRGARPFGTIENVVTHEDYRGHGLGKAVLRGACDAAWAADAYKVMLMTGSRRDSTLGFYEAAGFRRGKTAFEIRRP